MSANEILVTAAVKRIGAERPKRLERFAGDVRFIGRVLVTKFPRIGPGDVARKRGDDADIKLELTFAIDLKAEIWAGTQPATLGGDPSALSEMAK